MLTRSLSPRVGLRGDHEVVVIAASADRIPELYKILRRLPSLFPAAILVVIHDGARYETVLAEMLCRHCRLHVDEARTGDVIRPGHVYVAPARHVRVNGDHTLSLLDRWHVRDARSSTIDPLFDSVAAVYGPRAVGIVLSGTPSGAVRAAKRLHDVGGFAIAEAGATSADVGVTRYATDIDAVHRVLPLEQIPTALLVLTRRRRLSK